jgi:thiol-disulfide isomerase/thioredoxin
MGTVLALALFSVISRANADELSKAMKPTDGRPRVVHLWASWCVPCVAEWPHLTEMLRDRPDVDVVLVSLDSDRDLGAVEQVLKSGGRIEGVTLRVPFDEALAPIRKVDPEWDGALPTTYVIDADAKVTLAQRGHTRFDKLHDEMARVTAARARKEKER